MSQKRPDPIPSTIAVMPNGHVVRGGLTAEEMASLRELRRKRERAEKWMQDNLKTELEKRQNKA
jgi:hypothetical protein